jgi:hypothetical protein
LRDERRTPAPRLRDPDGDLLGGAVPADLGDVLVSSRGGGTGSAGGPGDLVTITIRYPIHFLTPMIGRFFREGRYVVDVSTTFRNEFFPQTEWH